ncbi:hypothetical protein [Phytomonospora endophytica]|uniref:hypothetical protein n=1 Tax=Phytomonospora endophytica TaxID=714109 RepID=UPI0019412F53|nr:hypothetical protein [Phytomonospora endophytica]
MTLTSRDISLRLRPGYAESHTDRSLGAQIATALSSALTGYSRAAELIRADLADGRPVPQVTDLRADHPRRRLFDAAQDVVVQVYSAEDFVSLEWRGDTDFTVELRPGTVRRLSEEELTGEVNSAVRAAATERRRRINEVHRTALREAVDG